MSLADDINIVVSDHAMWRAAERFRGFDTVRIETEVRDALRAGRVSYMNPNGHTKAKALYVWIPSKRRSYCLVAKKHALIVVTTMMLGAAVP